MEDIEVQFKTTYPIEEPYAYAAILEDPQTKEITYKVIEPTLTPQDRSLLEKIKKIFLDELDVDVSELNKEKARKIIEERVRKIIKNYEMNLDEGMVRKFLYFINRDFLGFEKIDPLMKDHYIEDISCDGVGVPIYVWHREYESIKTNLVYDNEEELNRFVVRLAYLCGKHLSIADPILDGSLPDGSRVNATYSSEISRRGTTFTIRRFRADPLTIADLINLGTISLDIAAYLWFVIENKSSILIAGEIASGKTTLLNCTSMFIRPDMKIVSIEETPELNLPHINWIPMNTRTGFGRKGSDVTLFDLLKNALRQRPDYIIVGEVRGQEAFTLFQALSTGHGVQATIHADTPEKVVSRLESEPMNVPRPMIGLLDIIIVQGRVRINEKPARRTLYVTEVKDYDRENDEILLHEISRWEPAKDEHIKTGESVLLKKIAERKGFSMEEVMSEINKRKVVLNWMVKKGMRRYMEIGTMLREYYADKERTFKRALVESL